jgi:5-methylcytosine-specific restriction endonuclease McrA
VTYRCTTCRSYERGQPYRRIGILAVCSAHCLRGLTAKRRPEPRRRNEPPALTRANVFDRDQHRCRFAGCTVDLGEHHIHYRSEGVDHRADNLIVLCDGHHKVVHSDKHRWQPVCLAYIAELHHGRQQYLIELDRRINPTAS